MTRSLAMVAMTSALLAAASAVRAAERPPACPSLPIRVERSNGDTVDYLGATAGIMELCHMRRTDDGVGDFYLGLWRTDWPGAGLAYPAIRMAIEGGPGTRTEFVTRAYPGAQWLDSYANEGVETVEAAGRRFRALRIAHGRTGIEGNTYSSVITHWIDLESGAMVRTSMRHISGQSYGPDTNWVATRIGLVR